MNANIHLILPQQISLLECDDGGSLVIQVCWSLQASVLMRLCLEQSLAQERASGKELNDERIVTMPALTRSSLHYE